MQFFIAVTAVAIVSSLYLLHQFVTRALAEADASVDSALAEPDREHLKAA